MTAIDEIRTKLDERGIEWTDWYGDTFFEANGVKWRVSPNYAVYGDERIPDGLVLTTLNAFPVTPAQAIEATLGHEITGETSDGYHTFNELYHHRALLFSVIVNDRPDISWKAKKHHDGTMYDGMFIVGIETPQGQATYHYDIDPYWEMFRCKELENAPEWDGHTPAQAIERIATLGRGTCRDIGKDGYWECDQCGCVFDLQDGEGDATMWVDGVATVPKFCPNCQREVVGE